VKKIGMITGNGIFPKLFLDKAYEKGIIVYPLALFDTVDEEIKSHANYKRFNIGQVGSFISFFLKENIKEVIMLGKVEKKEIFVDMEKDEIYELIMSKLPNKKDETLLMAVVAILRMNGIKMLPQNYLLEDNMTENRCYTKVKPHNEDLETIKIGVEAAKRLTEIDASQCVVVKDKSVVALEGIEGTDATIERAEMLAGKGTIIVKLARPKQDMRLDIPVIGMGTVKKAIDVGAKGIVVEAGKMMFLQKEAVIKLANENGIFIVGQRI
jgi:hypothetical protein